MSKHLQFAKVWCLALSVSLSAAYGADKAGLATSGNFMGGFFYSFKSGNLNDQGFTVDRATLKSTFTVSDKTKVVFNKAFYAGPLGASTIGANPFNSASYTSPFGFTGGTFRLAAEALYLDHKCADGVHTWIGLMSVPFGMESMFDRVDMGSYYYSMFYLNARQNMGLTYDLGVKFNVQDIIPGTLEIALLDGRGYNNPTVAGERTHLSPALALRYSNEIKSGDMTITPVVSAYLGRWAGFSKTWAASVGMLGKFGALGLNAEFLYGQDQANTDETGLAGGPFGKDKGYSLYVEPSFDLGVATISAKVEMENMDLEAGVAPDANNDSTTSNTDFNVGAAIGHTYEGGYSIKLAYQHLGLSGKFATPHINDVRLMFSTKW